MTVSLPAPRSVLSNESSLSQPDAAHLDSSPASESPPRAHWHLTPIDENVDAEHQHDDDGRDYVEEEYVDYGDQLYSDQLAGDALQVGDNDVDVHGVQVDDERELNHVDILLQNQLPPPTSASSQLIDFHSQFTDGTTGGGGGGASGTQQTLVVSSQVDGPRHVHFSQSTRGGEPAWGELHGVVSAGME